MESIDDGASARLGSVVPIGPRLALDFIDDGMARSLPKRRDRLIAYGLRVLQEPTPPDLLAVTRVLVRFANAGDEQRKIVADGLRDALGGSETARTTAEKLQALVRAVADEINARTDTGWLSEVRKRQGTVAPPAPPDGWADFDDEITTYPAHPDTLAKVRSAAAAVRRIKGNGAADEADAEAVTAALADDVAAKALTAALQHVAAHEPILVGALRDDILPAVHRAAIGDLLRQ